MPLKAKKMHGENLQSASALYVPLIHGPVKTAYRTAHLPRVFDLWKAQPAAATIPSTIGHFAALCSTTPIASDWCLEKLRDAVLCCGMLNCDTR